MDVKEILNLQSAAVYLGISSAKVLHLIHLRELGWMHLDDVPRKRKQLYTTRKFCDEYIERRMQIARGVVRQ